MTYKDMLLKNAPPQPPLPVPSSANQPSLRAKTKAKDDLQEYVMVSHSEMGSELKRRKTSDGPLLNGPWNNFSFFKPEGFRLPILPKEEAAQVSELLAELASALPSRGSSSSRQPAEDAHGASTPFVDMLVPEAANLQTRTENGALTFSSSGSSLVDFFYQVVEDSSCPLVHDLLTRGWQEDPLVMLQLIAHLRDIRNGKGETARSLDAYVWLAKHHPRTLLANLPEMVKCGYWKDLLELLVRLCVGEEEWAERAEAEEQRMGSKGANHASRKAAKKQRLKEWRTSLKSIKRADKRAAAKTSRAKSNTAALKAKGQADHNRRHEAQLAALKRARSMLEEDPVFRALHTAVALLFAEQLRRDLADLHAGRKISSLAAKWAPTPKGHHDKQTLIATSIAELLYPEAEHRTDGMPYTDYAELARRCFQKEYTTVLRKAAPVTEVLMSKRKWSEIDYSHVSSVCFKRSKKTFEHHDKDRLVEYLARVKKGEVTINAGALKPHKIVKEAMQKAGCAWMHDSESGVSDTGMEVAEAQWKAYVQKLREGGELSSAMAICDVSGSMHGQPMEVAIALSLLTAEVTKPPFNKIICTFSSLPELHLVQGNTLMEQVKDVEDMNWNLNTDINAVFELLLQRAVAYKLKPQDMIKTLFIFSDMEFDRCTHIKDDDDLVYSYGNLSLGSRRTRKREPTNYEAVKARFEAAGYALPQVVFWNLSDSSVYGKKSTPITMHEKGACLVSGFSGHLLKLFMDKGADVDAWKDKMSPMSVMLAAVRDGGRYDAWRVED